MHKKLTSIFADIDLICSVSELHGTMCGMLVGNIFLSFEEWMQEITDFRIDKGVLLSEHITLLRKLFLDTSSYLQTGKLDFQMLLPEKNAPYSERVQALNEWCAGFTYGIGVSKSLQISDLSNQSQILITVVSELSTGIENEIEDIDEDEKSYTQMIEYLNVGILSLCDDRWKEADRSLIQAEQ